MPQAVTGEAFGWRRQWDSSWKPDLLFQIFQKRSIVSPFSFTLPNSMKHLS